MSRERELLKVLKECHRILADYVVDDEGNVIAPLLERVSIILSQPEAEPARKIGGSYQANGFIVARFKTIAGLERVVFEFAEPKGMLHIFSADQIEPVAQIKKEKH